MSRAAQTSTDILWFFNDPAHYAVLVSQCGWTEHTFCQWLAGSMRSALLSDQPLGPPP